MKSTPTEAGAAAEVDVELAAIGVEVDATGMGIPAMEPDVMVD